jgi:inositol phosphorylceramide mannosyltransferase catalytic subunit
MLSLIIVYTIAPWVYAAWIWRHSTIIHPHTSNMTGRVPKIIHQTWRDNISLPVQWRDAVNSCRTLHSDYDYRFWTDESARKLIQSSFPKLLSTYDSYPYDIQRADVIRLIVLYVFGGVYLDLDIICLQSVDFLRSFDMVLPRTRPIGLSNDFIMSKPRHPFLLQAINNLEKYHYQVFTK